MKVISVIEKSDSITWEMIRETIIAAHGNNLSKGLVVRSTTMTTEQLANQVGDGKCFVAIDEGRVVGVAAVRIKDCNQWFCHSKVAHFLLDAVLPEYQGTGIYSKLQQKRYEFVEKSHVDIITTNTAATNKRMTTMLPAHGFHRALMFKVVDTDHFSITWVKWLRNAPASILCIYQYVKSMVLVKTRTVFHKLIH